jgi:hypothetical protein
MSLSICRSRSQNECSLGSRFDWFVVRHGHSSKDYNVKVLPKILARCYSFELAQVLQRHEAYKPENHSDVCDICTYSYSELQTMLARFDNRILSFPDVFYDESLNCV